MTVWKSSETKPPAHLLSGVQSPSPSWGETQALAIDHLYPHPMCGPGWSQIQHCCHFIPPLPYSLLKLIKHQTFRYQITYDINYAAKTLANEKYVKCTPMTYHQYDWCTVERNAQSEPDTKCHSILCIRFFQVIVPQQSYWKNSIPTIPLKFKNMPPITKAWFTSDILWHLSEQWG